MRRLIVLLLLCATAWGQGFEVRVGRPLPVPGGGGGLTFHNVSSEQVSNAASGETTPHTINSTLTNGCIIVQIALWDSSDGAITGVTFDGAAMSLLAEHNQDNFGEERVYIWFLAVASKAAASYNAVMASNTAIDEYNVGVLSYTGCHQTTQTGTPVDAVGTDATAEVTVTSATGQLVVGVVKMGSGSGAITSGEVERWDTGPAGDSGWGGEEAGAASVDFVATLSGATTWTMTAVPIIPAAL